jgi:hypothetical protein
MPCDAKTAAHGLNKGVFFKSDKLSDLTGENRDGISYPHGKYRIDIRRIDKKSMEISPIHCKTGSRIDSSIETDQTMTKIVNPDFVKV